MATLVGNGLIQVFPAIYHLKHKVPDRKHSGNKGLIVLKINSQSQSSCELTCI